ncbi:MAG: hypothetical protein RLY30_1439 [Pseudomonadota bacterium]|jgi:acyl-CoA synthetase (AMP-forming)/AMP-acid ligase II
MAASRWPKRSAVVDQGLTLSFEDLARHVAGLRMALSQAGLRPGMVVALCGPNSWQWIVQALALQSLGCILLPLSTRLREAELRDILQRSRASAVISVRQFLDFDYEGLFQGLQSHMDFRLWCWEWPKGAQILLAGPGVWRQEAVDPVQETAVADLMFTSGTTGRPKGVLSSQGQNTRAFGAWTEVVGLREDDRYLIVNPFFHAFGYKAGWLSALIRGACVYPMAIFDARAALATIEREQISFLPGPPTLFHALLDHPEREQFNLTSLRVAVTGAATIPPSLIGRMREELHFKTVTTAYGLTECSGVATVCDPQASDDKISTTSGRALPGVEVECHRPDGTRCAPDEVGEIVIRGFNVMQGYFEDERATQEAIDPQGWLHTGDVGALDSEGYLKITDRLKDMYISGGFNCYPAEIERLMHGHPSVSQAAVIGAPDARLGELGVAFVVKKPEAALSEADFQAWCKTVMSNYKVPRRVVFVDRLPLNAAGKVQKAELRARLADS